VNSDDNPKTKSVSPTLLVKISKTTQKWALLDMGCLLIDEFFYKLITALISIELDVSVV